MPATFATATHTGLVRKSNEDALFARAPVFVVADGMGGAQAGEVASGMATRAFEWFVPQTETPAKELARLISRVNADIHDLSVKEESYAGMGTTLTAAVVRGRSVSIAHVGDSRAYLWRDGSLSQLTEDHSLVGEMLRSGQITTEEAEEHPQRSIITRALGIDPGIDVDTQTLAWKPGDVFLLCSDGLYSMIDDSAIAGVLARGDNLFVSAWTLVEAANAAGGRDNISLVLFSPDGTVDPGVEPDSSSRTTVLALAGEGAADADEPASRRPAGRLSALRGWFMTMPGRIVMGLVLAVVLLAGAWFASRQVYYLGIDSGRVVIYRGVPYDLGPWSLSSLYRHSPVKYSELEPFEQERIDRQELQSQGSAEKTLENYSAQAKERKQEADRKAAEAAARAKGTTTPTPTVPSGALP